MTSAVDEVKDRLNIEDVIGQYVQLKRSGRNFKGLSPFSNERTASFIVSPEKQILVVVGAVICLVLLWKWRV